MTEEELARFALVLKECERLRALIAQEEETCLIAQSGRTRGASSTLPMMRRWPRASTTRVPMSEEE
jgi:hypothetical protein